MSLPDSILRSIDLVATACRAIGALERARPLEVKSVDGCLADLREAADVERAKLNAWAVELLGTRWGIEVGHRVSVSTAAHTAEGVLAAVALQLRIIDFGAFPQLALTIEATRGGSQQILVDAVGRASDEAKLYRLGPR